MAYVQNFHHDVFISYAHNDNLPDANGKCWVAEFKSQLETAIKQRLEGNTDKLDIFFDDSHLHANDQLAKLQFAAKHSALFLAIASPSYASRDWTKKELQAFIETKPDLQRLFAVERLPVSASSIYPTPLNSHTRMAFFTKTASGNALQLKPDSAAFEVEIIRLADQICLQLQHLAEPIIAQTSSSNYVPGFRHDVVISHAVEDEAWATQLCADLKKQLRSQLKTYDGFQIATTSDDSLTENTATLVAVTSPAYYQEHKVESKTLNQLAKQKALFLVEYEPCKHSGSLNGPTRHKFWLDDDTLGIIPISDNDYHFNLDKLVVAVADKLKQAKALKERQLHLEEHIAVQKQNMKNDPDFDCFVVLHSDEQDLSLAEEIGPLLAENGISYALPLVKTLETLSSDIRKDFESNVLRCNAILIFYDKTTHSWIREQIRICKDIERERGRELTVIGVHWAINNPNFGMWQKNLRNYECPPEDIQTYLPKFIAELKKAASAGAL